MLVNLIFGDSTASIKKIIDFFFHRPKTRGDNKK